MVISTPTDGQVLTWDTDHWENADSMGGGGSVAAADVTFTPAGDVAATDVQAAVEELDSEKAATVHVHAGEDITSGTVADARIASTIARDSEVTAAITALSTVYQPLDSDLTAIAALTTTTFGRAFLALADAAAGRTALGLGTAATAATGDFDTAGAAAAAQAASQPLDSDLTAIAALTTTSFGRALLALADAAALRTAAGLVIGTDVQAHDADLDTYAGITPSANVQTLLGAANYAAMRTQLGLVIGTDVEAHDADLTTIAGLTPTNDDVLQRKAGAWTNRTIAQLLTDLAAAGTTFQPLDSELTALAGLTSAADKLPYFTGSAAAAVTTLSSFIRTLIDDTDAATARATLGIWTADISEDGSSLTNWTQETGSWTVSSNYFNVSTAASASNRLRKTAQHRHAGLIYQATMRMVSGSGHGSDNRLGVLIGWDGTSTGGLFVGLRCTGSLNPSSTGQIYVEQTAGVAAGGTVANNFSLDTDYILTIVCFAAHFDVYLDGTYKGTWGAGSSDANLIYFGLLAFNCNARFKNIKSSYLAPATVPL